jgi:hypothetical protein
MPAGFELAGPSILTTTLVALVSSFRYSDKVIRIRFWHTASRSLTFRRELCWSLARTGCATRALQRQEPGRATATGSSAVARAGSGAVYTTRPDRSQ